MRWRVLTSAERSASDSKHSHGIGWRVSKPTQQRALYYDFRNGLIHESRIKRGAQFSLEMDPQTAFQRAQGVTIVNPGQLLVEVDAALNSYVDELSNDSQRFRAFAEALRGDHVDDH